MCLSSHVSGCVCVCVTTIWVNKILNALQSKNEYVIRACIIYIQCEYSVLWVVRYTYVILYVMWIMSNILFSVHTDVLRKRLVIFVNRSIQFLYILFWPLLLIWTVCVCVCLALYVLVQCMHCTNKIGTAKRLDVGK